MNRFKIGARLSAGFALLLLLMLAVVAIALGATLQTTERTRTLFEDRAVPLQRLSEMNYLIQRNRVLVMDMLMNPGASNVEKRTREFSENTTRIQALADTTQPEQTSDEEAALWQTLEAARTRYFADGLLPANQAMVDNRYDDAQDAYLNGISPLAPPVQAALDALLTLKLEQAQQEYASADQMGQWMRWLLPLAAAVALAVGATLAWFITRSITVPLRAAVAVTREVANGNLEVHIPTQGRDELTELLAGLGQMHDSLVRVVREVRQSSADVALSASEMAAGSNNLSSRTERQAANLEETSASVSELTTQVQQSADVAAQAARLVQQAHSSAADSGAEMGRMIQTMDAIKGSSDRINDITGMIDSIAFQTNILALNAAVEAARAGEQGRGFAVVAAEVRSLAQRSANAAREIKALIGESVSRTETGAALAQHVGQSVQQIQREVESLSGLIQHISQAGAEQSAAIGQISHTIGELDDATQQNAALVEQSAATAEGLRQRAAQLDEAVSFFKLGAAVGFAPSRALPLARSQA